MWGPYPSNVEAKSPALTGPQQLDLSRVAMSLSLDMSRNCFPMVSSSVPGPARGVLVAQKKGRRASG